MILIFHCDFRDVCTFQAPEEFALSPHKISVTDFSVNGPAGGAPTGHSSPTTSCSPQLPAGVETPSTAITRAANTNLRGGVRSPCESSSHRLCSGLADFAPAVGLSEICNNRGDQARTYRDCVCVADFSFQTTDRRRQKFKWKQAFCVGEGVEFFEN